MTNREVIGKHLILNSYLASESNISTVTTSWGTELPTWAYRWRRLKICRKTFKYSSRTSCTGIGPYINRQEWRFFNMCTSERYQESSNIHNYRIHKTCITTVNLAVLFHRIYHLLQVQRVKPFLSPLHLEDLLALNCMILYTRVPVFNSNWI